MKKSIFKKLGGLFLGLSMAAGVGVAVASNNGKATFVEASINDTEASGLTVLTSSNFDASAEYVLKSTDGYYWNGVSGTSSSKWGGITKTLSDVARVTISGTWDDGFTIKDSSNNYLRATTGNMTWATTQAGTFKMGTDSASNPIVYNGTTNGLKVNGTSGIRLYTNLTYNASTGKSVALYKIPATKTLSSISVSGYTTEFSVGDAFSFGGTVTATYSGGTTANVTSSATFSGYNMSVAGNYTVTASYTEGGTTKTTTYGITVSVPTTPTISLGAASFSGYTGQSFSVTATFANLTSDFAWSASGAGSIDGGVSGTTGDSRNGTSTYSGTLTGAGTKTLSASGGGATTQNYVITITQTTVSLNKNSTSIAQGKSETLTATSNAGSSFTWTSSNPSAATVAGGIVSVPSGATLGATSTITATSTVDTSVSATCIVTIIEAPLADILTSSVIPAAAVGSSTSAWGTASTFYDSTGAIYTGRFMGVSNSSFIGRLNDSVNGYIYTSTVPSKMKLKSVSIDSMTASKTVGVYAQSGAYTAAPSDKSTALGTLTSTSLTYEFADNTNYNAICLRGHSSATEIGTVTITYEKLPELSSVTTSGQTTSFTAGVKFSYGGTLTAHYTAGKADATVTPASYKIGASGIDPTSAGSAITTSTTLTKAEHDGKYIYVIYTEDQITKYCSYQITVNYAAVTSVEIDTHTAEIGLGETYNVTSVSVTIKTEYADQDYEWLVSANTVGNDYFFENNELLAGDTEGTITLRCRSTADNSKFDELVVTVTGDPVVDITPASVSGYVGKSVDVDFTYGNIDNIELINFASSDESVLTVGDHIEDSGEGAVTINFVGAGNATLSVSYNGGSTLDSITVTVSTDSVATLTWSAPTIKVYSGAITTVSDASSWNVHYTMASGGEDDLSYGEYTLKLGESSITLPHTWDASEDGKVLSIEYGGFASPTTSTVDVTQSLRPVNVPVPGEESTKTWTATAAANFGSTIKNVNDTDSGSVTFNNGSTMSYERTLEYVASGKADYLAFPSNYIQFGSSNALEKLVLTAATSGTVTKVVVDCWAKDGGSNISVTVGGNAFNSSKACPSAGAEVTFNGSATGTVVITMKKSSNTAGLAQYIKSVAITTAEDSGETTNIANVAGHEAAQKAVVAFAKAMNAAFDNTANCADGVADAWATASSAYSSNIANNASLSADEKAYAKDLIKYASAQYTEHTDNDYSYSLERAMATYEACIQKHGQEAFLSDVRSVSTSPRINPILALNEVDNSVWIISAVALVGLTAIGGYFFYRKRKEI